MIELQDVGIARRGRTIVTGATATLDDGTVTHLAGPSRSGKTTLLRAIAGIQRHSGSIRFDGTDVDRVRTGLYACFDDAPVLPYLSGYENVCQFVGQPLRRSEIAALAPELADDSLLRQRAHKLSRGQRKRLHLVAAIASGARYLVFDEVFDAVDAPAAEHVRAALSQRAPHSTVILAGRGAGPYAILATQRLELANGALVVAEDSATVASR